MYTDEEFEKIEEEEFNHTLETFAVLALLLSTSGIDIDTSTQVFYQKYGTNGVVTYRDSRKRISEKDKRKRITALFMSMDIILDSLLIDLTKEFKSNLTSIINREMEFFKVNVDVDEILNTKWGTDHLNWEGRLINFRNKWDIKLCNELKLSLLKGEPISGLLKKYTTQFGKMEKALWSLYTTESSAIQSIARNSIFRKMDIKKYRYYTRADERTCDTCGSMHGLIFPITAFEIGVTASPMHPHCRCWEVPIME